jgi:hypothetical protein
VNARIRRPGVLHVDDQSAGTINGHARATRGGLLLLIEELHPLHRAVERTPDTVGRKEPARP